MYITYIYVYVYISYKLLVKIHKIFKYLNRCFWCRNLNCHMLLLGMRGSRYSRIDQIKFEFMEDSR